MIAVALIPSLMPSPMSIQSALWQRLRQARKYADLTQQHLADALFAVVQVLTQRT